MSRHVPVFVIPDQLRITVFGGGPVALRKCRHFEGSRITIISETITNELKSLAHEVIRTKVDGDVTKYIEDADVVIAATDDPSLNSKICGQAASAGILANSSHGGGTLLIPSMLRRPGYTVAVSSEGNAPAFPPYIVRELDGFLDERYDLTLELIVEMKRFAKETMPEMQARREFLEGILTDGDVLGALSDGDIGLAREYALRLGGIR